ncbi:MAG: helix-turn-helix domain-containing protein [Nocardioidaceae bacterium]|nr:helix-turn-helix domain-containing protein [Nocardioidaceae bacterium]
MTALTTRGATDAMDDVQPSRLYSDELVAIPDWAQVLVLALDVDSLVEKVVVGNLQAAYPQHSHDEAFVDQLRASVHENVSRLRTFIAGQLDLDQVVLVEPHTLAAMLAQLGLPASAMQRSYRVGFGIMWEHISALVTTDARRREVGVTEALEVAHVLTVLVLRYQHHVASLVSETYSREERALSQSRFHLRYALVRQLLRDDVTMSPADHVSLAYDLEAHHLVVTLPDMPEASANRLLIGLRGTTSVRQTLLYPVSAHRTAVWLGRAHAWTPSEHAQLVAFLTTAGVTAGVSGTQPGPAGFRESFAQAEAVLDVRRRWGQDAPSVLTHEQVALECLLMADADGSRRFVASELGEELTADTADAAKLRQTLEAWLARGSHVGAADELGLHEHTVRNRLQRVEEHLGHDVRHRRTETEVALRLHRLLVDTRS